MATRSEDKIAGTLALIEEQLYRTCTYPRSYLVRSRRVWNTLPAEMRRNSISLVTFKTLLKQYYRNALDLCYDPEDARTWKSVCVKCNSARNLLTVPSCCFWCFLLNVCVHNVCSMSMSNVCCMYLYVYCLLYMLMYMLMYVSPI